MNIKKVVEITDGIKAGDVFVSEDEKKFCVVYDEDGNIGLVKLIPALLGNKFELYYIDWGNEDLVVTDGVYYKKKIIRICRYPACDSLVSLVHTFRAFMTLAPEAPFDIIWKGKE